MTKTAKIWVGNDVDGHAEDSEQLGTFTHYIGSKQFRFIVTRRGMAVSVTHRLSGLRVCGVAHQAIAAARNDYVIAGKSAVEALVAEKGADRVLDVLTRAETVGYGLLGGKAA